MHALCMPKRMQRRDVCYIFLEILAGLINGVSYKGILRAYTA